VVFAEAVAFTGEGITSAHRLSYSHAFRTLHLVKASVTLFSLAAYDPQCYFRGGIHLQTVWEQR
jgi:hypothetical protein